MNNEKRFAYDGDTRNGCACPAVAAGFSPESVDGTTLAAEVYDSKVHELEFGDDSSTIPEEKAKEAWLEAVEELEQLREEGHRTIKYANIVAEELGWD